MTNQRPSRSANTWRVSRLAAAITGCLALLLAAGLGGCGTEEEPAPVVQRTPKAPPPPPAPKLTPIADLMVEYGIDERVVLPEAKAPSTDAERIAVLKFFDAFARGDNRALETMMSTADAMELADLVDSGAWAETVEKIDLIEVQTGPNELGDKCALALFTVGMDFQPQLWYYEAQGEGHLFEAVASPPNILNKLSGTDWIKAWHAILEQELARADEPEDDFTVPQRRLDGGDEGGSASGGGGPGGPAATPPPARGRRPPMRNPRRAPGPR